MEEAKVTCSEACLLEGRCVCSKCRFSPPQPDLRSFLFHILSQLLLQLHCNLPNLPLGGEA